MFVFNNNSLNSLAALINLTAIGGGMSINQNNALASLSGLDNIAYTSINSLTVQSCPMLSYSTSKAFATTSTTAASQA